MPVAERAKALLVEPAVQPPADQPCHRVVQLLRGNAPEHRPADRRPGAERAAQQHVVGLPAPALGVAHRRPLEAEVADPVLPARVRAAVQVEAQPGHLVAEAALQSLDQDAEAALRLRHGEVAVRLARAPDRSRPQAVRVDGEAELAQRREHPLELPGRDAGEDEVLLARDADVAADAFGQLGQPDHLAAGDEAEMDGRPDRAEPVPVLGRDAHVVRRLTLERRQREARQCVPEPPLHLLAHPLGAAVVDHELEPRLHPRDAVAEVVPPGVEQRTQDGQRLVGPDPDAELAREPRHRREPAADEHGVPRLAVAQHAHERDAVDLRRVAAVRARGDGDLVLARQVRVLRVAVEERRHLVQQRRHVEQLVVRDAGHGAAGDVAHRVAAGAHRRQPHLAQPLEHGRQGAELEVVELDRLPGRQLAGVAAVSGGQLADGPQLLRRHAPGGQLDAEHERADLRLVVVDAPPLQPHEVLLGHVRVPRGDQRRQLVEHAERALLPLQPLDRIALQHELQARRLFHDSGATGHASALPCSPAEDGGGSVAGTSAEPLTSICIAISLHSYKYWEGGSSPAASAAFL